MERILSKSVITSIPGIGTKYAQRLNAVGIKKVSTFSYNQTKIRKNSYEKLLYFDF